MQTISLEPIRTPQVFPQVRSDHNCQTRWTFFRVKLVFEFEFELSWSLGPWDLDNVLSIFILGHPVDIVDVIV